MRKAALLLPVVALAAVLTGCGGASTPPAPVTVTQTAPAPAAAAETGVSVPTLEDPPVTEVQLPEVSGRNGSIVFSELSELGLTNFEFASQDTEDKLVLNPANWTAVEIEPGAGESVRSDQKVVITMTKEN